MVSCGIKIPMTTKRSAKNGRFEFIKKIEEKRKIPAPKAHIPISVDVLKRSIRKEKMTIPHIVKTACIRNNSGSQAMPNLATNIATSAVQPIINPAR